MSRPRMRRDRSRNTLGRSRALPHRGTLPGVRDHPRGVLDPREQHVERLLDRLVADPHPLVVAEVHHQPPGVLLRTPALVSNDLVLHALAQHRVAGQLRRRGPTARRPTSAWATDARYRLRIAAGRIAPQLPADRRRRPAQPPPRYSGREISSARTSAPPAEETSVVRIPPPHTPLWGYVHACGDRDACTQRSQAAGHRRGVQGCP